MYNDLGKNMSATSPKREKQSLILFFPFTRETLLHTFLGPPSLIQPPDYQAAGLLLSKSLYDLNHNHHYICQNFPSKDPKYLIEMRKTCKLSKVFSKTGGKFVLMSMQCSLLPTAFTCGIRI
uniref:Dolichyl-diphosphooligosaccharideprotein glycosyltransferase 48 kDa subunit Oligosaccharyl transferase 48 kDa subunit n=1 Tax=Rhizophora mucronata TaxID=61149 RepID=A0A2P2M4U9_RHIMU